MLMLMFLLIFLAICTCGLSFEIFGFQPFFTLAILLSGLPVSVPELTGAQIVLE